MTLEQRVAQLEKEVAALKLQLEERPEVNINIETLDIQKIKSAIESETVSQAIRQSLGR